MKHEVHQIREKHFYEGESEYYYHEDWFDEEEGRAYPCNVMQDTGLTDKNGTPVYEGDYFMMDDVRLVVAYEDGCYCFEYTGGSHGRDMIHQTRIGRLEIAGNIYEQP